MLKEVSENLSRYPSRSVCRGLQATPLRHRAFTVLCYLNTGGTRRALRTPAKEGGAQRTSERRLTRTCAQWRGCEVEFLHTMGSYPPPQ